MDSVCFDTLTKALAAAGTRRRLVSLLAALPLAGALAAVLDEASASTAKGRRTKRKKAHHNSKAHHERTLAAQKRGKKKKSRKKKDTTPLPSPPTCQPESPATTCAGKCATVSNNCGTNVDCGPCTCATGCHPVCQICNPATGVCDPKANGTLCDDGNACTQADTCQNGLCVGGNLVVCTASNSCQDPGTCDPVTGCPATTNKANGTDCGERSSGDTLRCCGGVCPALTCLALGVDCLTPGECVQHCCSQVGAGCDGNGRGVCRCVNSGPGGLCGSDGDCDPGLQCVCGTCS